MTTTLATTARSQIPGYDDAVTIAAATKKWARPTMPADDIESELLALALAGNKPPADMLDRFAARDSRFRAVGQYIDAVDHVKQQAQEDVRDLVRDNSGPAFTYLHLQLIATVRTVRELTAIAPASAELAAVARSSEQRDAWLGLVDAAATYDEIRAAQRALVKDIERSWPGEHSEGFPEGTTGMPRIGLSGLYADAVNTHGFWLQRRRDAAVASTTYPGSDAGPHLEFLNTDHTPVFSNTKIGLASAWWPDGEGTRVEILRTLATRTHPWVPTYDELTAAQAANAHATQAIKASLRGHHGTESPHTVALREAKTARAVIEQNIARVGDALAA